MAVKADPPPEQPGKTPVELAEKTLEIVKLMEPLSGNDRYRVVASVLAMLGIQTVAADSIE